MLNELFDEEVEVDLAEPPVDELAVRNLLIRDAQLERDLGRVKKTKQAVAGSYDEKITALEGQRAAIRSSLQAYVERNGNVKFEDVGTAYLAKGEPKVEVEDAEAFREHLAAMFVKEVFDETAAKAYALERATAAGEILPGVKLVPGGPGLRIRKS
jgi:hypothetical protein